MKQSPWLKFLANDNVNSRGLPLTRWGPLFYNMNIDSYEYRFIFMYFPRWIYIGRKEGFDAEGYFF
jgi:hypothetical protein